MGELTGTKRRPHSGVPVPEVSRPSRPPPPRSGLLLIPVGFDTFQLLLGDGLGGKRSPLGTRRVMATPGFTGEGTGRARVGGVARRGPWSSEAVGPVVSTLSLGVSRPRPRSPTRPLGGLGRSLLLCEPPSETKARAVLQPAGLWGRSEVACGDWRVCCPPTGELSLPHVHAQGPQEAPHRGTRPWGTTSGWIQHHWHPKPRPFQAPGRGAPGFVLDARGSS